LPLPAILGAKPVRKMRDKRPPRKRELKVHVLRRARKLAESGRFEGWQGIEFELRFFEGFPKPRIWLVGPNRKELAGKEQKVNTEEAGKMRYPICRSVGRLPVITRGRTAFRFVFCGVGAWG
jgi:hypothetical protein